MKKDVVETREMLPRAVARGVSVLLAVSLVTACSVLPKAESLAVYGLPPAVAAASTAASTATTSAAARDLSLRVLTPQSNQILNSTRILVQRDGNELSLYQGARWSDTAPALFRNRLIDAFRADGRLAAVLGDTSRARADRELTGDLLAFQTEYDASGAPSARVRFDAALVDASSARVLATRRFEVTQPLQGGVQVPRAVDALGEATDALAAQVVSWVLEQPVVSSR